MTAPRRRPVEELPGDPGMLELRYRMSSHDQMDGLWEWTVSVAEHRQRHRWANRWDTEAGPEIGSFTFYRLLDDGRGGALAAAEVEDTGLYHMVLPLTGWNGPGLEQDLEPYVTKPSPDLLVMYRARLEPQWRGFGLGAYIAAEAVDTLAKGCCAVLTEPRTREGAGPRSRMTREEWVRVNARISATWETVGFRPHPRGRSGDLRILDPSGETYRRGHAAVQAHYQALCEAYDALGRPAHVGPDVTLRPPRG